MQARCWGGAGGPAVVQLWPQCWKANIPLLPPWKAKAKHLGLQDTREDTVGANTTEKEGNRGVYPSLVKLFQRGHRTWSCQRVNYCSRQQTLDVETGFEHHCGQAHLQHVLSMSCGATDLKSGGIRVACDTGHSEPVLSYQWTAYSISGLQLFCSSWVI